jgi:transcriptional regulator with XRE-family HTH domain
MTDLEVLGERLQEVSYSGPNPVPGLLLLARHRAGVSQKQAAQALGKSTTHIWLIEKGHRRATENEAARLVELYGIPYHLIEHEVGTRTPQ